MNKINTMHIARSIITDESVDMTVRKEMLHICKMIIGGDEDKYVDLSTLIEDHQHDVLDTLIIEEPAEYGLTASDYEIDDDSPAFNYVSAKSGVDRDSLDTRCVSANCGERVTESTIDAALLSEYEEVHDLKRKITLLRKIIGWGSGFAVGMTGITFYDDVAQLIATFGQ